MKITTGSSLKIHQGNPSFQYLAAFTGTLTIITSGMYYGWPSPSLPKLREGDSGLTITDGEGSWMAVMPLLGGILGALIVGVTVDILGRKKTIILTTFPFFAGWIMVAFCKSAVLLYMARFLAGVADGWAFTAVPMYIGEIADPRIRGLLGSGVSVTWIFGILLINVIGSYLSVTVTALVSSLLPVLTLVTFIWMPESPYYLLMRGKTNEAKKSLQILRGLGDVDSELNRLTVAVKEQTSNSGKFLDLFTVKSNRKAVFISMVLRASQQLSGTTAIIFYTQHIFKEAGDDISPELATLIYFSVQLFLTMLCSSIVDRTGRRPLLIASITGSGVVLFIEGTYFYLKSNTDLDVAQYSFVPVAALIAFVVLFSLGMQSIPILMLGELFPANVKAFALCLADIYFCVLATIVSKCFQIMKDSFGLYVPFYMFTVSCMIGCTCIVLFIPETKGKTLEEIQMHLRGEKIRDAAEVQWKTSREIVERI
ncbi:facilitated trehalose transporter Tret1-like [Anoplophora glabripennis]|uniref:facilitated trehalose transporter Tret1-like n=1 Tax=Anoplophora glabripennis TaxID=217634 RepID=UPI000C792200|nr:facilitated trehalose transporter Tret1-like [Anoplophora glabripennis]